MRCADLTQTWTALRRWLDDTGVLVLPRLEQAGPSVRLDADVDQSRPATEAELTRIIDLFQAVVERFRAPAVYVARTAWDPVGAGTDPAVAPGSLAIVTVRVPGGGVVHELTMVAAWYAALLGSDDPGGTPTARPRRSANRNSDWWPAA